MHPHDVILAAFYDELEKLSAPRRGPGRFDPLSGSNKPVIPSSERGTDMFTPTQRFARDSAAASRDEARVRRTAQRRTDRHMAQLQQDLTPTQRMAFGEKLEMARHSADRTAATRPFDMSDKIRTEAHDMSDKIRARKADAPKPASPARAAAKPAAQASESLVQRIWGNKWGRRAAIGSAIALPAAATTAGVVIGRRRKRRR